MVQRDSEAEAREMDLEAERADTDLRSNILCSVTNPTSAGTALDVCAWFERWYHTAGYRRLGRLITKIAKETGGNR
jgi:hypothetical protein